MATLSKMTLGTQRLIANADIKHHYFPLSLFLFREELMNSVRYNAKRIWILATELPDGSVQFRVQDDGTGDASRDRLSGPAASNGGGTARYGAGLPITRLKRGNEGDAWSVAWKKAGTDRVEIMTNDLEVSRLRLSDPDQPWTAPEDHGFVHTTVIRPAKLEGVTLATLAPTLREITCVSTQKATLQGLEISIEVKDKTGATVAKVNSKDAADPWITFKEAVEQRTNTKVWATTTITRGSVRITVSYVEVKGLKKGEFIHGFPHYGAVGAPHAMLAMEGFVVADMPLHQALDRKEHGSSQNKKYLFATFDLVEGETDVERLPRPASTKTSFVPDCPIYQDCMEQIRNARPPKWADWKKDAPESPPSSDGGSEPTAPPKKRGRPAKVAAPAPAPAPEPAPAPKPAPAKLKIRKAKVAAALPAEPVVMVPEPAVAPEVAVPEPAPVVDADVEWFRTVQERLRGLFERHPELRTEV